MYYKEFEEIIEKILSGTIEKNQLETYLMDAVDCEKIYDSDDLMTTDIYFSIKHFANGEEEIDKNEWQYFLDCLSGKREYDLNDKMKLFK